MGEVTSIAARAAGTGIDDVPGPAGSSFFRRTVIGWDVAFWAMLAVGLTIALNVELPRSDLLGAISLLVLLGIAYATVGRPAIRSRARLASHVYVMILIVTIAGLVYYFPEAAYLFYIAFPQIWVFSERIREGAASSLLLVAAVAVAEMARSGWSSEVFLSNLPWWLISLAISGVFGTWVSRIIEESEARAELIETLERTRAELAEANHAAGVVAERERIALEIHDTLAQGFTGIITLAGAAQAHIANGHEEQAASRLAMIEEIARDNLAEARALVAAFAPVGLDDSTLADALRRLAGRFEAETGVVVDVLVEAGDERDASLPASYQVVLLRTAQEALANVSKHAHATRVRIELTTDASGVAAIEVTDDGGGFELTNLPRTGFGLSGMRGRVEEAGGRLEIDSAPGAGTIITVRLPAVAVGS